MPFKSQQGHMTDLINRVDKLIKDDLNAVQDMVNKYTVVLEDVKPQREIPYYAYLINACVTYINENHKDEEQDWKTWATVLIRNLYSAGVLKKEKEIGETITEFLEFKKTEYENWCNDIVSVNDFERDRGFMYKFYFKKNR